ncbi:MAG: hypothetical protein LUC97_09540 [Clostridiales bacterium]|nr:hypothetical protein [Clostridiales bacterium]
MENLRELLNIYFSEDAERAEEAEGTDSGEGAVYENTYESIFNTFNKEEKYITNVFKDILNEKKGGIFASADSPEAVVERAFRGAGKAGNFNASAYYNQVGGDIRYKNYFFEEKAKEAEEAAYKNGGSYLNEIENNILNRNVSNDENIRNNSSFYNEAGGSAAADTEDIFDISHDINKTDVYGDSANSFFDNSQNEEEESSVLSENIFNYDYKNGGAEETVGRAGFSAFVPSQGAFAEEVSNILNESGWSENINDVLNNYYGNTEGSRSITNNISPTFNLYGGNGTGEIDIDEIAEKIGEMLAEAAAGSADGFYG